MQREYIIKKKEAFSEISQPYQVLWELGSCLRKWSKRTNTMTSTEVASLHENVDDDTDTETYDYNNKRCSKSYPKTLTHCANAAIQQE